MSAESGMSDKELAEIAQGYLAEITRLRAENARLREALEQAAVPKIALRRDEQGELDDIVVEPVEMFRMEFMTDNSLWIACYLPRGDCIAWQLLGKNLKLTLTEEPGEYEDWDSS